ATVATSVLPGAQASAPDSPALERLRRAPSHVILADGSTAGDDRELVIERSWDGAWCRSSLVNQSKQPVAIKEIVLFDLPLDLPPETTLYGESFQMLSETVGTLGNPIDLGYSETQHYKIPQPPDVKVATGLLTLTPPARGTTRSETQVFAFTS